MPDSVFTRTHPLPDGPRVRLRHARPGDREGVVALLRRRDAEAYEFGVRRLLRFDPAQRTVLAAFALIDGTETLIGIAAIDHDAGATVDTFVADERWWDGLAELLLPVLDARMRSANRHVA